MRKSDANRRIDLREYYTLFKKKSQDSAWFFDTSAILSTLPTNYRVQFFTSPDIEKNSTFLLCITPNMRTFFHSSRILEYTHCNISAHWYSLYILKWISDCRGSTGGHIKGVLPCWNRLVVISNSLYSSHVIYEISYNASVLSHTCDSPLFVWNDKNRNIFCAYCAVVRPMFPTKQSRSARAFLSAHRIAPMQYLRHCFIWKIIDRLYGMC